MSNHSHREQSIIQSMIHSWDYFSLDFEQQADFLNAQSYVPNGFIELVFLDGLSVYEAQPQQAFERHPQAFAWGQTKFGNKLAVTGTGRWFEIKLYPWAFNLLFGHPTSSLPPGGTALNALNKDFESLAEAIASAQSSTQAIQIFKQFAAKQLRSNLEVKPFVIQAYRMIYQHHGQIKVSQICHKLNVSRQHFHQYFKEKIGLPPKTYSKIIRLRHTVDMIYANKNRSLTEIAMEAGYFDQAHFITDFKSILGQTPKSFFKQKQFIYWDINYD